MPKLIESSISCGIRLLKGLCRDENHFSPGDSISPKNILLEAFDSNHGAEDEDWSGLPKAPVEINFGIVLFSDSLRRNNGSKLATYITKQKLGKVVASDVTNNPNTRRDIQLWTWYIDREALVKWFKAPKKPYSIENMSARYFTKIASTHMVS